MSAAAAAPHRSLDRVSRTTLPTGQRPRGGGGEMSELPFPSYPRNEDSVSRSALRRLRGAGRRCLLLSGRECRWQRTRIARLCRAWSSSEERSGRRVGLHRLPAGSGPRWASSFYSASQPASIACGSRHTSGEGLWCHGNGGGT